MYVRIKDIPHIVGENPDYTNLMIHLGYKKRWIGNNWLYRRKLSEAYYLAEEARKSDVSKLEIDRDYWIDVPDDIDHITFIAMMELQMLFNSDLADEDFINFVIEAVAKATFSSNNEEDYDSSKESFIKWREKITHQPYDKVFGIYNWLDKALRTSDENWNNLFTRVAVHDKDYEAVGGQELMSKFNVDNTVKNLCQDYNVPYKEAWQLSYLVSQINSYEKATRAYIQAEMTKIKEAEYRRNRNNNP